MTTITRLGYVADFCPLCVALRTCALERLEAGAEVEHQRVCVACKVAVRADPECYASIAPAPGPVDVLKAATFPDLEQVHRARLDLESQLRTDPSALDSDLRRQLLREPLTLAAAHVAPGLAAPNRTALEAAMLPLLRHAIGRMQPSRRELGDVLRELVAAGDRAGSLFTLTELLASPAPASVNPYAPPAAPKSVSNPYAPPAANMTSSKGGPEQAALLLRIIAVLGTLLLGGFLISVIVGDAIDRSLRGDYMLIGFAVTLVLTVLCWMLPRALERREGWARGIGLCMAFVFLWVVPIGTMAGMFIGYCLIARWSDPASRPAPLRM